MRPAHALLLVSLAPACLAGSRRAPVQPVSTYSIVARDPATGQLGVAVQSHWFSVGSVVTWAEPGVGAVATQSLARPAYGPELLADLRAGLAPEEALGKRTKADEQREVRQVGVVDAKGRVASFTGKGCIASAASITGEGFAVQANIMVDDGVVPAMAAGYRAATGDFAGRLLAALEAAQAAGGDLRGMQSAAMLIVDGTRHEDASAGRVLDLRVEDHAAPLSELRRLVRVHAAYAAATEGDDALGAGDLARALSAYARAEELLPEQVELSYWRATALLGRGEQDEAFAMLRRVFAREPRWTALAPRLAAAGLLTADQALLDRIASLAPASDLRAMASKADAPRLERDVRALAGFGTRHTLSSTTDPSRGIGAARAWLREEMERISRERHEGRLRVELASHRVEPGPRVPSGAEVVNVLGTLPGAEPDRLVVISGHYDSRASDPLDATSEAPGANDDASGVAAVLEAARLLGGLVPRASLVFVAVAGEEQGLLGSDAQAKLWKAEGKNVVAMITMDIVGGATGTDGVREPWRVRVFSEGVPSEGKVVGSDSDAPSRQLARYLERATESAVPGFDVTLVFRQDRYLRGGDHRPFNALGWPAVRLTEPHENWDQQHQDVRVEGGRRYGDLPEHVDFAYVARVASGVAATAAELAIAPPSPRDVKMDVKQLSPSTRLTWSSAGAAPPAGFAVLMRRTHEPAWTERREVGAVSEVTLENVSKDDWLFAVEAFDEAGHRSLPIYPDPAR